MHLTLFKYVSHGGPTSSGPALVSCRPSCGARSTPPPVSAGVSSCTGVDRRRRDRPTPEAPGYPDASQGRAGPGRPCTRGPRVPGRKAPVPAQGQAAPGGPRAPGRKAPSPGARTSILTFRIRVGLQVLRPPAGQPVLGNNISKLAGGRTARGLLLERLLEDRQEILGEVLAPEVKAFDHVPVP